MRRGHPLRPRSSGAGEQGTTLVEVVATLAILTIVLATVYGGVWSTQDAVNGADERLRNLDEARVLMAATSKDVRTAVRLDAGDSPFVTADGNEIEFYANLDPTEGPKRVRLSVDGDDQLVEEVWEPDPGSAAPDYTYTGDPRVRFVGRYVANDESDPIFTFLDANGDTLADTPLDDADRRAVEAVRIRLVVKKTSGVPTAPTTLVNRVRLPNIDYNAVAE